MHTETQHNLALKLEAQLYQLLGMIDNRLRERAEQLIGQLKRYYELSKQRNALRELSDEQLEDIGISRADALREAAKPFWKE
ncbi:MAG: DUF1127 domain-containing protein [Chromatiales bacterium]|nr:DUF1127 domain-containing protein [Chromatiales bacterium]